MSRSALIIFFLIIGLSADSCRNKAGLTEQLGIGSESPVTIVFFVTADCPLCKIYRHKIASLKNDLPDDWKVIAVREDTTAGLFRGSYGLETGDPGSVMAKSFGAEATPQVFVVKGSETIVYSGAIDNYAYDVGRHRQAATEHYLDSVIQCLKKGSPFQSFSTSPVGCYIE